jgi:vitamin B12 transporter
VRNTLTSLIALCCITTPAIPLADSATINVTASRIARSADDTQPSVSVIDRAAIEQTQAHSLIEILDGLAGLSVRTNGGLGKVASLHLRGTNSGHLLLLIDGVRTTSATLGVPPWHTMPASEIERIEIVRGPRSHLYGSEAIGGVIQVFTRQAGSQQQLSAGAGSNNTSQLSAALSLADDKTRAGLSITRLRSDGFDATLGNNPDDDGMRSLSLGASLNHDFGNGLTGKLHLNRNDQTTEYDGWTADGDYSADYLRQSYGLGLAMRPNGDWGLELSASHFSDAEDDRVDGVPSYAFDTERDQIALQGDLLIGDRTELLLGGEWMRESVDGTTQYSRDERDQSALFGELQWLGERFDLSAGARRDDFEALGQQTTGNLALGWQLGDNLRLTAAIGSAFKAPTFNDLYYVDPWGSNGNPELEPEESWSGELGLNGRLSAVEWDLRLYQTDIENLIQWSQVEPYVWQPQNLADARLRGLELAIAGDLADWQLQANLSLLDSEDEATGKLLPLRASRQLRIDLDREFGRYNLGASWLLRGSSYSDTANTQRMAGYGTLDLRGDYQFSKQWRMRASLRNLFDQKYQESAGYNTAGREWRVSVIYSF